MEPFKSAISPDLIRLTGHVLARHMPGVDPAGFAAPLIPRLDTLELKQRVGLVAEALHAALPDDPDRRRAALLAMLHPDDLDRWNADSTTDGLCGWGIWPLTTLVGRHGLGSTAQALETLREMTKRGTAELDVRPFIAATPDRALPVIRAWVSDPNPHVRRLVSEGTRPRLPWGMRLHGLVADPTPMLPALTRLRDDPSDYVRRSVANHLNDIARDHPDLVADIARTWLRDAGADRRRLLRHACRTLIKQGHTAALSAFGFDPPQIGKPAISLATPVVRFGETLEFEVTIRATGRASQTLALDYVIHHQKADGTLSPKVFKWTTFTLDPGDARHLSRRHALRPITTRRYHAGPHALSLRINGTDHGYEMFELVMTQDKA
ncbi:MAG: DNA alkylation repair protein [Pseudomonadota bacterium]